MGRRILIVNVNWLGDVLFSTASIRALRKKYPDAFIACMIPKRCEELLANNPHLNEVIVARDRVPFLLFFEHLRIIKKLKRFKFDTAIFFHRSKTKALWTRLAGIPERIGYAGVKREKYLTRSFPNPAPAPHRTDYFLKLLEQIGVPSDGREPDFYPKKEAETELKALFEKSGIAPETRYAVMHAGGNWELKRWPAEHFVEWARLFTARYSGKVILCGTASEKALSEKILSHFQKNEVISFCGQTSTDALALLLKNAKVFLSNDSGPIHLAASQGAKIIGVFGPTSAEQTGPVSKGKTLILRKDVGCEIPCYYRSCDYRICMEWLKPSEVFEKTAQWLEAS